MRVCCSLSQRVRSCRLAKPLVLSNLAKFVGTVCQVLYLKSGTYNSIVGWRFEQFQHLDMASARDQLSGVRTMLTLLDPSPLVLPKSKPSAIYSNLFSDTKSK